MNYNICDTEVNVIKVNDIIFNGSLIFEDTVYTFTVEIENKKKPEIKWCAIHKVKDGGLRANNTNKKVRAIVFETIDKYVTDKSKKQIHVIYADSYHRGPVNPPQMPGPTNYGQYGGSFTQGGGKLKNTKRTSLQSPPIPTQIPLISPTEITKQVLESYHDPITEQVLISVFGDYRDREKYDIKYFETLYKSMVLNGGIDRAPDKAIRNYISYNLVKTGIIEENEIDDVINNIKSFLKKDTSNADKVKEDINNTNKIIEDEKILQIAKGVIDKMDEINNKDKLPSLNVIMADIFGNYTDRKEYKCIHFEKLFIDIVINNGKDIKPDEAIKGFIKHHLVKNNIIKEHEVDNVFNNIKSFYKKVDKGTGKAFIEKH